MAYDIKNFASLGLLWKVLQVADPDQPAAGDIALVEGTLAAALADIQEDRERGLSSRLNGAHRQASRRVRELLQTQWEDAD
jgi:malonate decarboxylase gamma subunit